MFFKGNNARLSLPMWLPRNAPGTHHAAGERSIPRPQSSIAHVNLGPASQTYVVTDRGTPPTNRTPSVALGMSSSVSNDSNLSEQAAENQEINSSVNPSNNNNIHDNADNDSQSEDGTQQVAIILSYKLH